MSSGSSKSPGSSKLKPLPRPLFSCGIFRNCTQSVLSPTAPDPPPPLPPPPSLPPPPNPPPTPPPPPPPATSSDQRPPPSSSSSSSSSTSPSFTQWRFPLHHTHEANANANNNCSNSDDNQNAAAAAAANGTGDSYGAARERFRSGASLAALRILEKSDPGGSGSTCPVEVMAGVVAALKDPASARPAAKVLLAMLLVEPNRRIAVEAGAVAAAVEAVVAAAGSTGTSTAERALAALELMCMTDEGSLEVRNHALAAPAMGGAVESMQGRGRECAIGVLAAVYGGEHAKDAPEEAARAVMVAMQGECSARGRRKGGMLLRAMQECGRLDLDLNFD